MDVLDLLLHDGPTIDEWCEWFRERFTEARSHSCRKDRNLVIHSSIVSDVKLMIDESTSLASIIEIGLMDFDSRFFKDEILISGAKMFDDGCE